MSVVEPNSDGTGVQVSKYFSAFRSKNMIETDILYDKWSPISCAPKNLVMDFSRLLEKPFFSTSVTWAAVDTQFKTISSFLIPSGILTNNIVKIPFEASALYRARLCIMVQVSGTPMHAGIVMVAASPKLSGYSTNNGRLVNALMSGPHVFLSANDATPACFEVPFYFPSKLALSNPLEASTFYSSGAYPDFASLQFKVLNPLVAPTAGSTSVNISVHVIFKEIEFYTPHGGLDFVTFEGESMSAVRTYVSSKIDSTFAGIRTVTEDFIDAARGQLRALTGLHNANDSNLMGRVVQYQRNNNNNVDIPTYFEKLDPYADFERITTGYTFDTNIDEMDLNFLVSKPYYLGTFVVKTADSPGLLLWSRPITPVQESPDTAPVGYKTGGLEILSCLFRAWRGTLKIHIQSACSDFHFTKFLVSRNYVPTPDALTKQPTYSQLFNLPCETVEFSGGGQVQTFDMPYCSINEVAYLYPNDYRQNALSSGMYYISLLQSLVTNGSVATSANFNVYLSAGEDFQFYGYATEVFTSVTQTSDFDDFVAESKVIKVASDFKELQTRDTQSTNVVMTELRPVTNLRDVIRRFYSCAPELSIREVAGDGRIVYDIATILGVARPPLAETPGVTPIQIVSRMFHGFNGGVKFKLVLRGVSSAKAYFVPPGTSLVATATSMTLLASSVASADATYDGQIVEEVKVLATKSRFPLPFVDLPNYDQGSSSIYFNISSDGDKIDTNVVELEFEVPNMSQYRFICDTQSLIASRSNPMASASLGNIVIAYTQQHYLVGTVPTFSPFHRELYVAIADEGRYGFQHTLPILTGVATDTTTTQTLLTPYNSPTVMTPFLLPRVAAPLSYYNRAV